MHPAAGTLAEEVRQNFQRLHGQRIRGIRWDRYDAEGQFLWHVLDMRKHMEKWDKLGGYTGYMHIDSK